MRSDLVFFLWSTCAVLNVILALIVLCMMISGESAYRYVAGSGWLARLAHEGSKLPALFMFGVMSLFLIIALYCIAGIGVISLPAVQSVLIGMTLLYLLRGSVLIVDRYIKNPPLPTFVLMGTYGALAIGALQTLALLSTYLLR